MSTTDLMQRVAQLTAEQRILLQERLQAAHKSGSRQQIQRRTDMGPAPLSFSQERLWFLAQLEPESTAYNETSVYRLSGRLKLSALERGLDALSARHDCLRVCFHEMGGSVVQIAEPLPPTRVNSIDLKDFPENEQMDLAWQKIDAAQSLPFDLTVSPLWRVFLICMADDDYLLVRITHHIISDGWSNGIFWRELQHFYAAYATSSEPSPLPELPISYADFSVWQ